MDLKGKYLHIQTSFYNILSFFFILSGVMNIYNWIMIHKKELKSSKVKASIQFTDFCKLILKSCFSKCSQTLFRVLNILMLAKSSIMSYFFRFITFKFLFINLNKNLKILHLSSQNIFNASLQIFTNFFPNYVTNVFWYIYTVRCWIICCMIYNCHGKSQEI